MPSLIESNPYLRDPEERKRIIAERTWESSVFEGAIGLPHPAKHKRSKFNKTLRTQRSARRMASEKKADSGA